VDLQGASVGVVSWQLLVFLLLPTASVILSAIMAQVLGNYNARTVRIDEKMEAISKSLVEQKGEIQCLRDAVSDLQSQPAAEMADMWSALSKACEPRRAGTS
jgi:hypothetical protein